LRAVLAALATASVPSDMALPGLRRHPLQGDRAGRWSVSISGNWRVIFPSGLRTNRPLRVQPDS
jgi:toxin HigB-1